MKLKKIISVFLALIITLTAVSCVLPATMATEPGRAEIPIVYIEGTGQYIFRKTEDGSTETIFPIQISEDYINEQIDVFLPVFAKAFFTQQWDEFCDVLYDIINPVLSKMKLDKNGEVSDGSFIDWTWSRETLPDMERNGTYGVEDYKFRYDWRLSPLTTAEQLHQYIEDVLYVTGAEKVALCGRCYASNIVAAYMQKYDGENVREVIHYASAANSAQFVSKLFTGELHLDADSINRFMYDVQIDIGEDLMTLLQSFVTLFNKTYGLDIACWAVNNVFEDIYLEIIPPILIESYATFPSYWSMVSKEDYNKAKETIYYGSDKNEYSGLISKTDEYYNEVQLKFNETLKRHEAKGIEISNIVKYGKQDLPATAYGDKLSDYLCTVEDASFGATTALIGETFSDEYIDRAIENRTAKYISPEKQIDASTCLFPDTTWFIKDLDHYLFPHSVNNLISEIVNNDGYTVESNKSYPQYIHFDEKTEALTPLTGENMNTTDAWTTTYFEALKTFFKTLFKIISQYVGK